MNDHQVKDIVIYKGWTVGFRSIFHTNSQRQAMMNEVQVMMNEVGGMVAGNGKHQTESIPSFNKHNDTGDEQEDTPLNGNVASGFANEYLNFKKFYRQSSICTMLQHDETSSFEFNICLRNLGKLDQTCQDNQHHFDNSLFVAWFNKFNLQKKDNGVPNSKSDQTKTINRDTHMVTPNVQTSCDQASCDIKLTLRSMLDNVDNDEMFGQFLEQLLT